MLETQFNHGPAADLPRRCASTAGGREHGGRARARRVDTDGHGYQALAEGERLTRRVNEAGNPESVFIRVYPWFMTTSCDSNYGVYVQWFFRKRELRVGTNRAPLRLGRGIGRQLDPSFDRGLQDDTGDLRYAIYDLRGSFAKNNLLIRLACGAAARAPDRPNWPGANYTMISTARCEIRVSNVASFIWCRSASSARYVSVNCLLVRALVF
jgi:hypothetical protein